MNYGKLAAILILSSLTTFEVQAANPPPNSSSGLMDQAPSENAAMQLKRGKQYSIGMISSPDYSKATQYFSLAANQNHPEAQYLLALCYQNGLGVTKDFSAALYWYQQAIKNGLEDAPNIPSIAIRPQEPMAINAWPGSKEYQFYKTTLQNSHAQDAKEEALDWLMHAAEKDHPQAQFEVGLQYFYGENVAQNDEQAWHWFTKAADKNHQEAQSFLSWMAALGLGMSANLNTSIQWFLQARQLPIFGTVELEENVDKELPENLPESASKKLTQFEAGMALTNSPQTDSDKFQGLLLVENAAKNNLLEAQLALAEIYLAGKIVNQNATLAAKWYEKAARNGNAKAQYALGWLYYNGQGVQQNKTKSYTLFSLASKKGMSQANSAMQFVKSQLEPIQHTPKNNS